MGSRAGPIGSAWSSRHLARLERGQSVATAAISASSSRHSAAAAFTAYLWATGNAREFGDPPVWDAEAGCIREGIIVSV